MNWVLLQTNQQPYFPPPPLSSNLGSSSGFSLNNKVSPSILLIIIILAIIFFISGLLHLLVRFMLRPPTRDPDDFDNVTALQGQLQQLFTLHDAGVDQSFIDTLLVFNYKSIIGVKDPFDCAVCLCEFEAEDKLRLLPKCSHAFHMECIDTWLLSHSTCPLCRGNLIPDFPSNSSCSPIVHILESGSESSREIVADNSSNSIQRANSQLGVHCDEEFENLSTKHCEIKGKEEENKEKVVTIKLGKFKNVDGGGEGSSGNNIDGRRCFSMGSFEYVMDENSSLQVPIRTPVRKQSSKKSSLPLTPGHRVAMSECGGSRREFNGFEAFKSIDIIGGGGSGSNNSGIITGGDNAIGKSKRESFSVSKIWLRAKKDKLNSSTTESSSSRRSFSFRFPIHRNNTGGGGADELKVKNGGSVSRRTISEVGMARWENGVGRSSELGIDEENQSCYSLDSQANPPSFARRTLLWLMGRQNKELQKELNTEKNYNVYAFHVKVLVFQGLLLGVGNLIILYMAGRCLSLCLITTSSNISDMCSCCEHKLDMIL